MLCTGIAMLLSALFVYFRDIQPIWEVLTQVIFYASPIIIPIAVVQEHLSPALVHLYMLNPLAVIFQQFRHAFINHATPSAADAAGLHGGAAGADRDRARASSSSASGCSIGSRRAWPRTSRRPRQRRDRTAGMPSPPPRPSAQAVRQLIAIARPGVPQRVAQHRS